MYSEGMSPVPYTENIFNLSEASYFKLQVYVLTSIILISKG
jgi:hypothetical protein